VCFLWPGGILFGGGWVQKEPKVNNTVVERQVFEEVVGTRFHW